MPRSLNEIVRSLIRLGSIPPHTFAFMKIVNLASHSIYFYIFRMLPVNELAVISPEWRTTGSLPGYLPTEAATGSRPNKMYYIEANP